jgi:hypothetical protein
MIHALAGTVLSVGLLAASPTGVGEPGAALAQTQEAETTETDQVRHRVDFSFDGGTASQLFAQLQDVYPDYSLIVDKNARRFQIDGFDAKITDPSTIVDLVCGVTGTVVNPDGLKSPQIGKLRFRPVGQELVQILFDTGPRRGFGPAATPTVEIISIQELLTSGMTVEAIFGTVQAAIDLRDQDSGAKIRFHEETGVLFVKGIDAVNEMVGQTIDALKASAKWLVSDEALAAKEARIRSDALDALEVANQAAFKVQEEKMRKMMKDHEALMERDRRREDRKDAELQRQLDQEDLNEDD